MIARQAFLFGVFALAAGSAMADDITLDVAANGPSRTRASVRAEVIAARKAGEMLPAGEIYNGWQEPATSGVARSTVKSEVLAAQASGQLRPPGEADPAGDAQMHAASTLSRAAVKAEVLAARQAGTLIPAGEADPAGDAQMHMASTVEAGRGGRMAFAASR